MHLAACIARVVDPGFFAKRVESSAWAQLQMHVGFAAVKTYITRAYMQNISIPCVKKSIPSMPTLIDR